MNTLESITAEIVDCEHKTSPVGDGFAYAVGTRAMKGGRIVLEQCRPVTSDTYTKWARRAIPEPGDLVLAREAPVGEVVRLPEEPRFCLGQRTVLIKPDNDRADGRFLHYWLQGPSAQHSMHSIASGATTPHLNVGDIRALPIESMPRDLGAQRAIGSIFGSIDDLIENNRRRIEVLEEMAQAIYREWFVHFRYPGYEDATFVDSPLGPIPEGWELRTVASLAADERNAVTGGPFGSKLGRKDYVDTGVPIIRGTNLRVAGGFNESDFVFISDDKASELRSSAARRGDVVITQRGTLGQVGLIPAMSRFDRYIVSQSQMKFTVDGRTTTPEFVYAQFCTTATTERFIAQAMSSGVPHVNLKLLREFELLTPPIALQLKFTDAAREFGAQAHRLHSQIEVLGQLRDVLLPKLVTGEIDVSGLDLDALLGVAS